MPGGAGPVEAEVRDQVTWRLIGVSWSRRTPAGGGGRARRARQCPYVSNRKPRSLRNSPRQKTRKMRLSSWNCKLLAEVGIYRPAQRRQKQPDQRAFSSENRNCRLPLHTRCPFRRRVAGQVERHRVRRQSRPDRRGCGLGAGLATIFCATSSEPVLLVVTWCDARQP